MTILQITAPYLGGVIILAHLLPTYILFHMLIREHKIVYRQGENPVILVVDLIVITASVMFIGMILMSIIF